MNATIHKFERQAETPADLAPPAGRASRIKATLKWAAREPFFQFLLLGLLIWSVAEFIEAQSQRYTIHIGPGERARLSIAYQQQYNQAPTDEQLQALVDRFIRQQIFVREGKALGLDKSDEIVDRRIAQKFEFLQQDLGVPDAPDEATLRSWFEAHKLQYLTGQRTTFTQVYFSPDRDGDTGAKSRALRTLAVLRQEKKSRAPSLGDAFPGPTDLGALGHDEVVRLFGESPLTDALAKLPVGQWAGPLHSGYGWHLIYVNRHLPPVLPAYDAVRDRVASDYREEIRRQIATQEYEKLRNKYRINYDGAGQ